MKSEDDLLIYIKFLWFKKMAFLVIIENGRQINKFSNSFLQKLKLILIKNFSFFCATVRLYYWHKKMGNKNGFEKFIKIKHDLLKTFHIFAPEI